MVTSLRDLTENDPAKLINTDEPEDKLGTEDCAVFFPVGSEFSLSLNLFFFENFLGIFVNSNSFQLLSLLFFFLNSSGPTSLLSSFSTFSVVLHSSLDPSCKINQDKSHKIKKYSILIAMSSPNTGLLLTF